MAANSGSHATRSGFTLHVKLCNPVRFPAIRCIGSFSRLQKSAQFFGRFFRPRKFLAGRK
jgi:hypothetical protein